MLAAQLNELVVQQSNVPPEAAPRNLRNGGNMVNHNNNHVTTVSTHPVNNILDVDSDFDSEPEDTTSKTRNDGTLLASDPPKPL